MTLLPSPIPHPLDYSPWDLPGWIYEALDWVIGVEWPEGDERAVWDLADQWYAVAASLAGPQADASTAAAEVHQGYGGVGAVAAAFGGAWRRVADGEDAPLPVLLAVSHDLGRVVEECGCDIEGAKLEVWIELGILVVELLALAVAAVLTAGAASPAAAGVIAATRFIVQQIFRRLLAQLARKSLKQGLKEVGERAAKQVTTTGARGLARHAAREGLTEAAQEAGVNLATQVYQQSTGRRHELDVTDLSTNAIGGLAGGAAASLAGLGRHATGGGARMAEHLGREMTGEVIADQAASLATGQGLTSLEDAARAAASGARGSATGQADRALQARLDGQLAALSGPTLPSVLPGPAIPAPAAPELTLPLAGGASTQPTPVVESAQGAAIPAQRTSTEPPAVGAMGSTSPAAGPALPLLAADSGVDLEPPHGGGPVSLAGSALNETVHRPPDPGLTTESAPTPGSALTTELGSTPESTPVGREVPASAQSSVAAVGPASMAGLVDVSGPALSTVAPPSVVPGVATGPDMTAAGGVAGGPAHSSGAVHPGGPVHASGPVAAVGISGSSTATGSAAAGPVMDRVPGASTATRPEAGSPGGPPSRPEPSPAPPRSALVEALVPNAPTVNSPGRVTPPTAPPTRPDPEASRTADYEALERRRYQGYYESQRAWFEEKRRLDETMRLRSQADEHYQRASDFTAYARQLHQAGHRDASANWQQAAKAETRAYGRCLDLADAVASGAVVPDVVAVDRPEDFHRINDDVGDLAVGAIDTGDRSALTGDDHPPPIDRSRRYGQPGGLRPPLALHQRDVEQQLPRDEAGNVVRTADPRAGDWFGLMNDGGPRADPTRGINCLDCTLSLYDTWVQGRPRVAAPRTFDAYQAGDVTRPLNGEQDGTGRVEDVTGGRFQRLCDGTARTPVELQRALDTGYRNLRDQLVLGGHGSFAFVVNHLERGGAHIWVALNQNGTVLYVDPQVGLVSDQPLYRYHGPAHPFNAVDADVLVLDGGARPMPLAGLRRGIYSQRPDLPRYPPAEEFEGYGDPYLNRVHLLGDSG
ncbi:toxin glutamine deamidase domain-containing protein [Micromonospora gifhornensis]|uniref:toxin glutamine deamidase domain-containing protein n=1 Tax=Micromonospora gifhornensis TaxID=84594 RepID=UPI003D72EE65